MKPTTLFIQLAVLGAFGILTLFLSSAFIFDMFSITLHVGNYFLFIANDFLAGIIFLTGVLAFFKGMIWSKKLGALPLVKAGMLACLPIVFVASCGHRHGGEHDHQAPEVEELHHHEGDVGQLVLNNGEKWEADEHTITVVEDMKSELSDFVNEGGEDYHVLADSLSHQLSILVAGCTMKGPAHDELHKWLVPVTESVKGLADANAPSDARNKVNKVEERLREFDDFFGR